MGSPRNFEEQLVQILWEDIFLHCVFKVVAVLVALPFTWVSALGALRPKIPHTIDCCYGTYVGKPSCS